MRIFDSTSTILAVRVRRVLFIWRCRGEYGASLWVVGFAATTLGGIAVFLIQRPGHEIMVWWHLRVWSRDFVFHIF